MINKYIKMKNKISDYLIKGINNVFYFCEKRIFKRTKMDENWQKLYDDLKDPNVSKEDKDKIWTFIQNESQRFMEFAYPRIINDEDRKQIKEMKEKFLKLDVGSGDGYLKDLLGDPMHNEMIDKF